MIERALELQALSERLEQAGDLAGAETACREALEIFVAEEGERSPDVANLCLHLGRIVDERGRYADAEDLARCAVEAIEPLIPQFEDATGREILLQALGLLGTAIREQGRYEQAEAVLQRAVHAAEGLGTQAMAMALNNLGVLYKFWGKFELGEQAYRSALELAIADGFENTHLVATLYHNLGGLDHARGRFAEAEGPARQAWEIRRELSGDESPDTMADASALGGVLDGLGRYRESRPLYENAIRFFRERYGEQHYEIAANLHNLAGVEDAEGNTAEAVKLYVRALTIKEQVLGVDHPDTALTAANLGALTGDRVLLERSLRTFERTLAPGHPHIEACRRRLAKE